MLPHRWPMLMIDLAVPRDVEAEVAGAAAAVLVLELLAVPHPATTTADVVRAAITAARNCAVLRLITTLLPGLLSFTRLANAAGYL